MNRIFFFKGIQRTEYDKCTFNYGIFSRLKRLRIRTFTWRSRKKSNRGSTGSLYLPSVPLEYVLSLQRHWIKNRGSSRDQNTDNSRYRTREVTRTEIMMKYFKLTQLMSHSKVPHFRDNSRNATLKNTYSS